MRKAVRLLSLLLVLCMMVTFIASCTEKKPDTDKNDGDTNTPPVDTPNTPGDDLPGDEGNQPPEDLTEYLPPELLAKELSSSIWKTDKKLGNDKSYGLTDPSNVGIDKDRFENEVLYPVPADSEFAKIFNVTEYGVSTENADNSAAINSIIEEAKAIEGLKKIYFPKGVYKIANTILIENINDLYFCGDDFEFLGTRWFSMFRISYCENVHINGLKVDFDPSPVVTGTAISYDPIKKQGVYKIDDEFDLASYISWVPHIASYMEHEFDEITGKYYPSGYGNVCLGDPFWAQLAGFSYDSEKNEMTINFKADSKEVKIGTRVSLALTNKSGTCFTVRECKNAYWEDVTVYCNPGAVYVFQNGTNMFFNNINITFREGSSRMMTSTSDAMHVVDVAGKYKVTNSTIQGSLDDCMNVYTQYRTIASIDKNVLVSDTARNINAQSFFYVGDKIELFDPADLSSRGYYTIVDLTYENLTWTFTLDKEVPAEHIDSIFANDTQSTELIVDNNIFGNKRNRGFLVQCRDVTITNNVFANFVHCALVIHSVRDVYGEGMVPKNVTVKNNKFINNYDTELTIQSWGNQKKSPGVITGITIENNLFAHSQSCPISASTAGDSSISNNMFYDICEGFKEIGFSSDLYMAVYVVICENMTVSKNLLYTDTEDKRLKITGRGSMYTENSKNVYKYGE